MMGLENIAFTSPWLLLGLLSLAILWWLLRATPPAPRIENFPGVRILLGLEDKEKTPDKTPWWLLLLRMLAIAAAVLAFAAPVLNPIVRGLIGGPLLVVMDGGWASSRDWQARQIWAEGVLGEAARGGRPVAFQSLGALQTGQVAFQGAADGLERLPALLPGPFEPDRAGLLDALPEGDFETVWLHDGIARDGDDALIDALKARGAVTMVSTEGGTLALTSARLQEGEILVDVARVGETADIATVHAVGPDPSGIDRVLARSDATFEPGTTSTEAVLDLPLELRNRITRFELSGTASAGAVQLASNDLKRRKVALITSGGDDEGQQLVQPMHYLRKALIANAEIVEAPFADSMLTAPDMIILADVGNLSPDEEAALTDWVLDGGLLLRFAGPRLAQATSSRTLPDPLLPVSLRAGGRSVGGAMSWGAPKRLRPFDEKSPFFGLALPGEVDVTTQVMAQPDPDLPNRVMAALEDGTPLVTGRTMGEGRLVLFHVTANAEWSSLPLSGLFVQMLERLAQLSGKLVGGDEALEARQWAADTLLDGFGRLQPVSDRQSVEGAELADAQRTAATPPGIYRSGEARVAINLLTEDTLLEPITPPVGVAWETMGPSDERPLQAPLLIIALILLGIDVIATLWVSGRLRRAVAAAALLVVIFPQAEIASAQTPEIDAIINAANNTVLAYVETGDPDLDRTSRDGLIGLSRVLNLRTAIEPVDPVAVNLDRDTLAIYPFLYWPISETQDVPTAAAYAKLNGFLRSGGMIMFDTRDAHLSGGGGFSTPNGRVLQRIAARLDVPPLMAIPQDHVLTRTFYLLQSFPGRWNGRNIWVEAAPEVAEVEGMPFRNLNDGVTPIIIGGNDWAAAWAITEQDQYSFPVGSGAAGDRQREMAYRFGVNLIMHVMTGNYKSDQVHVPALLERLGQ